VIPDTSVYACLAQEALLGSLVVAVSVDRQGDLLRTADDTMVGLGAAIAPGDPACALLAHGLSADTSERRVRLV
jgi:hypothetical protein